MSSLPVIETFGLTKRYGKNREFALHDLDLTIEKGEVYGYLGPNGAGKTTTIRLLMNFIQPTFGNAVILSQDIVWQATKIKKSVGYLSGEVALYPRMTGREFLTYMARLQPAKHPAYARELVKRFQAEIDKKIADLSKGNRQKLGIIQAFMHEPEVFILDEPTGGLDPLMQETFYEIVRDAKDRGATLFISSHNLTEVQKMCDRVGFIRAGELIAEQTIGDLSHSAVQTYDISFSDKVPVGELKRLGNIKVKTNTPRHATIYYRGELKKLLNILSKYNVVSIERQEINLEDEFLKFYKGGKQ